MPSLKNNVVFITGATSGIGEACAYAFAAEGAKLLLAARRSELLDALQPKLIAAGAAGVHSFPLDVRDAGAVQDSIAALPSGWREIDIFIANAGLSRGLEKLWEGSLEDWDEMIDTNIRGVLSTTKAVVPGMIERGRGHVVNLGSTAAEIVYPNGAVYCATKAALKMINDGLRIDLLGTPIRVTSVDPGMVETDFSKIRFHGDEARAGKVYQGLTPLQPKDVAETILWAVSRPAHVNIAHVLMTTIHQGNSLLFHRE